MRNKRINYRKEAFLHPWNLTFLGIALAAAFVVSVIPGLRTWLFQTLLLFTGAAELLILGWFPNQERFRKVVRARQAAERSKPPSKLELMKDLSRDNQRRFYRLQQLQEKIESNYRSFGYAMQGLLASHTAKINKLMQACLKMMRQQDRLRDPGALAKQKKVMNELLRIEEELKGASGAVRSVQRQKQKMLQMRLRQIKQNQEDLEVVGLQIEAIEIAVEYIFDQSQGLDQQQNQQRIESQLNNLLTEVEEAEQLMEGADAGLEDEAWEGLDYLDGLGGEPAVSRRRTRGV